MGDSKSLRDLIIEKTGIVEVMNKLIQSQRIAKTLLKTMCWVNSNINRFKNLSKEIVSFL